MQKRRLTPEQKLEVLEQKRAKIAAEEARIHSRLGIKNLASQKVGQKILRALRNLNWVVRHPVGADPVLVELAARASAALVKEIAKECGILPEQLAADKDDEAEEPEEPELPFDDLATPEQTSEVA